MIHNRTTFLTHAALVLALCVPTLGIAKVSPPSGLRPRILDIGIILRQADPLNGTIASLTRGIDTAKSLFEERNPKVTVKYHSYTHGGTLDSVVTTALKIVQDKEVPAIIGGEESEESLVLRDLVSQKRIVFLTPTSSNPTVTEGYPFAFRACYSDRTVAKELAQFTLDRLKPKALGVIHNISSPYSDFLSREFLAQIANRMRPMGQAEGTSAPIPIIEEKVIEDAPSFDAQIQRFMEKGVTHVALFTHQNDVLKFVLHANKKGFFPVYIGSDGWGGDAFVLRSLIGATPEEKNFLAFRSSYWRADPSNPMTEPFVRRYTEMYQSKPDDWSAMGFDSLWIMLTAMSRVQNPRNSEQIRAELASLNHLPLVTNPDFSFGADRSPKQAVQIYRLDRQGVHFEETRK